MWRRSVGTVWSPTVTVHAPCLSCSAQTLPSPPFISSTSTSWRLLRRGPQFPALSRTLALPDRCQFYVGRIRNASYCSAAWKWCQLSCRGLRREAAGGSSWRILQRRQPIASSEKLARCFSTLSAVPRRVSECREGEAGLMSSFQQASDSGNW